MAYFIIPAGEHWAVIRLRRVTIPGDERSRTNPGHGYPEHTENYLSYDVCASEDAMREKLARATPGEAKGIHVAATFVPERLQVVTKE